MARVIGIDLGTTNSVVAVLEGGDPVVIPTAEGTRISALGGRTNQNRRARHRTGRETSGDHQPGQHDIFGQALHGAQAQRPGDRA